MRHNNTHAHIQHRYAHAPITTHMHKGRDTRNCTTYEYTMGTGGPCALWASPDSDAAKRGSSYWCGAHLTGSGGSGEDSRMGR